MISLLQLLKETQTQKILVPRRSPEERAKNHLIATNRQIQEYIKNGSQGDLDLSNTPIKQLPPNLIKVGGNLDLKNTQITQLPDNLQVKGSLYLGNTQITHLPDNLQVGRYIWVNYGKERYFKNKYPQYENNIM